jgi:hypothetical protein
VIAEFGTDEFDVQMAKLLQLCQTGTVYEYRMDFEVTMYHLLSLDATLNSRFFVTQFVLGLKDELCTAVRLQAPTSVTRAVALARIQEEEMEHHKPKFRQLGTKAAAAAAPAPQAAAHGQRLDVGKRVATDEYTRERQLRDFRKASGLCFKCGETYSRDHQHKKPLQLLTIQIGEHGEIFTEDTVQALELLADPAQPQLDCCLLLSAHVEAGSEGVETMQFRTLVGNQVCLILVDSGSSTSFVNASFVQKAALPVLAAPPVSVKIADGTLMSSAKQVTQLTWWMQGNTFATDMRILSLGAYDAALGMDWLKSHSPMTDWDMKFMEIPSWQDGAVARHCYSKIADAEYDDHTRGGKGIQRK